MINFSKFTHFLDLWITPKDSFEIKEYPEVIIQPDNVCPRCSSDSGFRTNHSYFVRNWACKNCLAVWMTMPETHDND